MAAEKRGVPEAEVVQNRQFITTVDVGAALTRACWAVRALWFLNVKYDTAQNWRISSIISVYTGPIFAIFSPYESTCR